MKRDYRSLAPPGRLGPVGSGEVSENPTFLAFDREADLRLLETVHVGKHQLPATKADVDEGGNTSAQEREANRSRIHTLCSILDKKFWEVLV